MRNWRVEVREVRETWATVPAVSAEEAIRLVKVSLSLAEEQADDETEKVEWDFPQPLDIVECDVVGVREVRDA